MDAGLSRMMRRFAVVVFQTVYYLWGDQAEAKGGGVCFFPLEERAHWQQVVGEIVQKNFYCRLGKAVEVGVATLDEAMLLSHCQNYQGVYWQGGDTY